MQDYQIAIFCNIVQKFAVKILCCLDFKFRLYMKLFELRHGKMLQV